MTGDPHIDALRALLVADHEARIAEVARWADEAAQAGDEPRQRWHLAHLQRLRAMPYPWQHPGADEPAC